MSMEIVQSTRGVTLLGGGESLAEDVAESLTIAPVLVAADSGADRALALGRMPDAVIGDFDSLSEHARRTIAPDRLHPIAEQDSTDFGKCLIHVRAPFYLALGFTGMRLDHTLATLSCVARHDHRRVIVLSDQDIAFLAPPEIALDLPVGERISLFPFGSASGRSDGLKWPIEGLCFSPAGIIGTSNEVTGRVTLSLTGPVMLMLPKIHLRTALCALVPQ
ncbi:MAG: thiamine diphosphokinase [Rhodobacteraceae bacterium]|nr:thiamine diphosphokinase [Paracoccaceae bacterium]